MTSVGSLLSVGQNWTAGLAGLAGLAGPSGRQTPDEELRVAAIHDPPYLYIQQQSNGSYTYDGYLYELWQILAREAGVRYRIIPHNTTIYGHLNSNGSWAGLLAELVYGRADVVLSWLSMNPDRQTAVKFLDAVPISWFQPALYVRRRTPEMPRISSDMLKSLLEPLHSDVWWALLASLLVLSVGLRVTLRFNHWRAESRRTVDDMPWSSCLLNSFLSVVGQGWANTPDSLAARTATISIWVLGILLHASYTANLMSYLTVLTPGRSIQSMQEFRERNELKFALEGGELAYRSFQFSGNKYYRDLFDLGLSKDRLFGITQGNWPAFEQTSTMLISADIRRLRHVYGQKICQLTILPNHPTGPIVTTHIPIAERHGALRDVMNKALMIISEAGITKRLQHRWLQGGQFACDATVGFEQTSFGSLLGILLIVPLAVLSSVAILALERLWYRNQRSLLRKVTNVCQVPGVKAWTL